MDNRERSKYVSSYKKEHYKTLSLLMPKKYYDEVLLPEIKASGKSANSYILDAIRTYSGKEPIPLNIEELYFNKVLVPYAHSCGYDSSAFIRRCIAYVIDNSIEP